MASACPFCEPLSAQAGLWTLSPPFLCAEARRISPELLAGIHTQLPVSALLCRAPASILAQLPWPSQLPPSCCLCGKVGIWFSSLWGGDGAGGPEPVTLGEREAGSQSGPGLQDWSLPGWRPQSARFQCGYRQRLAWGTKPGELKAKLNHGKKSTNNQMLPPSPTSKQEDSSLLWSAWKGLFPVLQGMTQVRARKSKPQHCWPCSRSFSSWPCPSVTEASTSEP